MRRKIFLSIVILLILFTTPLLGVIIDGSSVLSFLVFPPKTKFVSHQPFLPLFFYLITALAAIILILFIIRIIKSQRKILVEKIVLKKFPQWGWFGLFLLIGGWILAWTRFEWANDIQIFTFTPIWIGYIILVNITQFICSNKFNIRPFFEN